MGKVFRSVFSFDQNFCITFEVIKWEKYLDQFSWTSRENSLFDNFCPQDGHFPL